MRLQTKVLLVALPLAAVFAGIAAVVSRSVTENLMVREVGRRLRPQAEDFAATLARDWGPRRESTLLGRLQSAQAFSGAAFAEALTPDGEVAAHTNVLETGKRRDDPDARAALKADETIFVRADGPRGPLLLLSTPVWRADAEFLLSGGARTRLGTLRLGLPLTATLESAGRVAAVVAALSSAFCLVALALILGFVRVLLLRPVQKIEAATARVAAGHYDVEVPAASNDELGDLAGAFNRMGRTLSRTVVSRDRLEEALAIARATLDASADGILVVDQDLKAITYNRRFVEMWGFPEEMMRGGDVRAMAERVKGQVEDPEQFVRVATAPVSGDQERRDIIRLKDGRVFDRISHVYRIGGQPVGRTITTRDLTLHHESVRALAQARDRAEEALAILRATIDASADGILVVGKGARIITNNKRFLEMWSLPEEMVHPGSDNAAIAEHVKSQILDGDSFAAGVVRSDADFEASERRDLLRLKDGRVFERISRPYLFGGHATGRTLTFRDLTLHLEGLRALAQARDEAVEAAGLKSRFLASVSHELRTPLNAVVGSAELLLGTSLDAVQREHADNLGRAARTLLELVDGVLDFSKIEAGRMTVERTHLTPGALLADAAALLGPRAAEKGLALRADAGEAAALDLLGDPTRLRQVLLNLLANAVKFTARGEVSAGVSVLASGESWVELEFSVRDTGIGISPAQAAQLFSPFMQGDGSTTRRYGGTGLGLAISRSLVELMGGTIGFESEPGRGARFWFRVRLERAEPARPDAAPDAAAGRAPASRRYRLRILIVEDNAINRRLLGRQLERLGCPSVAVADGRAALEILRTAEFGLILLDCQMPELDGYATAAEIRRLELGKRRTPIVAFTANASEDDRRRCVDAGMDDFASKPVTLETLAAAIERWDRPFDETALAAFASVAGDGPGALAGLLEDFLSDSEKRLRAARAALDLGERAAAGREAHAIKGAAAAVGARGLAELCRRLDAAARPESDADASELAALLAQADAEVARLRADAVRRRA